MNMRADSDLSGKKLLLGISGGIAAYKSAELARLFKKAGAEVQVLMTPDAARFITPLTLGTLSEREVLTEIFPENETGSWTKHVTLGLWADLFIIAPATAQTIAKLANGFSDSMLTATALSARCPVLVCPSMDRDMFAHPATKANLERLSSFGYEVMAPGYGELASGLVGEGRLPEPEEIFARATEIIHGTGAVETFHETSLQQTSLQGKHVLVTAGPTREPLDAVRVFTNRSSGRMGYALAQQAAAMGARVTLVSGPTTLKAPAGVTVVNVETAQEMYDAVMDHRDADIVLMAAAVADYAPAEPSDRKLKKKEGDLTIELRRTRDILAELGKEKRDGQILVGFAMETGDGRANAERKLKGKNLDWIALNHVDEEGSGFGSETNRIILIGRNGQEESFPLLSKDEVARRLLERVVEREGTG